MSQKSTTSLIEDLPDRMIRRAEYLFDNAENVEAFEALPPTKRRYYLRYRFFSWLLLLTSFLFFLWVMLLVALNGYVLPRAQSIFNDFSQSLQQQSGIVLTAEHVEGSLVALNPKLTLIGIHIQLNPHAEPITAKSLQAELGWEIMLGKLRFRQLHFDALNIHVERGEDGVIRISGKDQAALLPANMDGSNATSLESIITWVDWVFRQNNINVSQAVIHWSDLHPNHPRPIHWTITTSFALQKNYFDTKIRADLTWAEGLENAMTINGRFTKLSAINWMDNVGELSLVMPQTHWEKVSAFFPDRDKWSGKTEGSLWWYGSGINDSRLVIDANAENLLWQAFPLTLQKAGGQVIGVFNKGQLRLNTQNFLLTTTAGSAPIVSQIQLQISKLGKIISGDMFLPKIDLLHAKNLLKSFVQWIPEVSTLEKINPAGLLENSYFSFTSPEATTLNHPDYQFSTTLSKIGWQAWSKIPGVSGLSGMLVARPNDGTLQFNSQQVTLDLPEIMHVSRHEISSLEGALNWQILPTKASPKKGSHQNFALQFLPIRLKNIDGELELSGDFKYHNEQPLINISAILLNGNGRNAWRYMPKSVNRSAQTWLAESIVGGLSPLTHLTLRGNLNRFPFPPSQSLSPTEAEVFQVLVPFRDARLQFQPDWPPVEDASGLLTFTGAEMSILVTRGFLAGANAEGTKIHINDLDQPVLDIKGTVSGDINQFKDFMLHSPLDDVIPGLAHTHADGATSLELSLSIPINNIMDGTQVHGVLRSSHPTLSLHPNIPLFKAVNQETQFDQKGIISINATGRWLDSRFELSSQEDRGRVNVSTDDINIQAIKDEALLQHPWLSALEGSFRLKGDLQFNTGFGLSLVANTEKIASNFPPPFSKPLSVNWPGQISLISPPVGSNREAINNPLAELKFIGKLFQSPSDQNPKEPWLELLAEWRTKEHSATPPDTYIHLSIQDPLASNTPSNPPSRQSSSGFIFDASIDVLNLQDWLPWLTKLDSPSTKPSLFKRGYFHVNTLQWGQHALHQVDGSLYSPTYPASISDKMTDGWRLAWKSAESEATIDWKKNPSLDHNSSLPSNLSTSPALIINAQWDGLDLAPFISNPSSTEEKIPISLSNSQDIPYINLTINHLRYHDLPLGTLTVEVEPFTQGYRLKQFQLSHDNIQLSGNGETQFNTSKSQLRFNVAMKDLGETLRVLTGKSQMDDAALKANGLISWSGQMTDFSLQSAQGEVEIALSKGRFLEIEPGVGRLLGLLSLQSIFRRITFDFSDSLRKGFAFDNITGHVKLNQAELVSNDMVIESSAAKILMQGRINLLDESQHLEVVILPDISGGIASGIAYFINPLTGVMTWLTQKIIGSPFDYAFARKLEVTGSWGEPKVKELPYQVGAINSPQDNITASSFSSPSLLPSHDFNHSTPLDRLDTNGFHAECR